MPEIQIVNGKKKTSFSCGLISFNLSNEPIVQLGMYFICMVFCLFPFLITLQLNDLSIFMAVLLGNDESATGRVKAKSLFI